MRTIQFLAMRQWLGRASLIVYMVLSLLVVLYISSQALLVVLYSSSQATTVFVAEEVSTSIMSLRASANGNGNGTPLPPPIVKEVFPVPQNNVYYDQMEERAAGLSLLHQRKFLARKDRIVSEFDWLVRFQSKLDRYAAIIISDKFSFLHVWKCGGTTVADIVGAEQWGLNETAIQQREWVAVVRDPIDRFLSAWAECGFRQMKESPEYKPLSTHTVLNWLDGEYDFRVRAFLNEVREFTFPDPELSCHTHAHPQTNFMINSKGEIDNHVKMVGDLSELRPVLEIAGVQNVPLEQKGHRDASSNTVKGEKFPARRHLLQDQTLLELCKFYAMDYYLFEFEPPAVCLQSPGGPLLRYQ
jgi:hypothetical protein